MTGKHSPGPWRENEHGNLVCYPKGLEIGLLSKQLPDGELEANTRLIIAAPDLIEAMKGIEHFSDALSFREDHLSKALRQWIDAGRAAIAKAEGRS